MWLHTVPLEKRPDLFCEDRCRHRQWVLVRENAALDPSYIEVSAGLTYSPEVQRKVQ